MADKLGNETSEAILGIGSGLGLVALLSSTRLHLGLKKHKNYITQQIYREIHLIQNNNSDSASQ